MEDAGEDAGKGGEVRSRQVVSGLVAQVSVANANLVIEMRSIIATKSRILVRGRLSGRTKMRFYPE